MEAIENNYQSLIVLFIIVVEIQFENILLEAKRKILQVCSVMIE